MSDSVRPHRRQPTRLPCPWDSPGKNTGVGCHFLLQWVKVKSESEVTQSCPTLSDPMDCSFPGSSIHEIFQARVVYFKFFQIKGEVSGLKQNAQSKIHNQVNCLIMIFSLKRICVKYLNSTKYSIITHFVSLINMNPFNNYNLFIFYDLFWYHRICTEKTYIAFLNDKIRQKYI